MHTVSELKELIFSWSVWKQASPTFLHFHHVGEESGKKVYLLLKFSVGFVMVELVFGLNYMNKLKWKNYFLNVHDHHQRLLMRSRRMWVPMHSMCLLVQVQGKGFLPWLLFDLVSNFRKSILPHLSCYTALCQNLQTDLSVLKTWITA